MLYPKHFYNTFTINLRWQVVTSSNLNLKLKLLLCSLVTINNNLPHSIYCENIANIAFLFGLNGAIYFVLSFKLIQIFILRLIIN